MHTRLYDAAGQGIEITDFAPRFWNRGRMFRPLTIVRRVQAAVGHAAHALHAAAALRLGRGEPEITRGSTHLRYVGPAQSLRLNTDAPIELHPRQTFFVVDRP